MQQSCIVIAKTVFSFRVYASYVGFFSTQLRAVAVATNLNRHSPTFRFPKSILRLHMTYFVFLFRGSEKTALQSNKRYNSFWARIRYKEKILSLEFHHQNYRYRMAQNHILLITALYSHVVHVVANAICALFSFTRVAY